MDRTGAGIHGEDIPWKPITRRALLRRSTLAFASAGMGLPLLSHEARSEASNASRKLRVVVAGAHRMTLNLAVEAPSHCMPIWDMMLPCFR